MCGLDTIHSSLRLSSLGSRLFALKWRRLILVTLFAGLEVLPPLGSLLIGSLLTKEAVGRGRSVVIRELGTVGLQGMGKVVEVAFGIVVASMVISLNRYYQRDFHQEGYWRHLQESRHH